MDKEILKTALFGYSKISVCQYIATMNEEFNAKLMAETESFREERTRLHKKIDDLEAELATYKQTANDIGEALLDAHRHADQIRQQAEADAAQLLKRTEEDAAQLLKRTEEDAAQLLKRTEEDAAELRSRTEEDAAQLRRQAEEKTEQFLLEFKEKEQAQTQKLTLYTEAIMKLREAMAALASQTDDALYAFMEQFLDLRQNFEDSE